jgi:type VI secretion system protein ImpK
MNNIAPLPLDIPKQPAANHQVVPTLCDLLEDGFYLLFLLRDGNAPTSCPDFNKKIDRFLAHFDKQANNFGIPANLTEYAKYAYCALLDEIVLASGFPIRNEWARFPIQLRRYNEHLAGEGFFERLRELRSDPVKNIEALEVFHTCLLLGFQGKFLLEGLEKRDYLTHQLGQEIQRIRNEKAEFAPNWKLPHRFQEFIRNELPMWFTYALLALIATGFFVAYKVLLDKQVNLIFGG